MLGAEHGAGVREGGEARGQLVAGTLHYFTIEVNQAGAKKLYEAKVWVKEWESFKELQEFKPAD
jgi:hypothetical protein